jgi:hypothetical protein
MTKKLSHSAASKYNECGKSYELHYIKRWRAKEQSAALLFGTAIDKALEAHLLKTKSPLDVFNDYWNEQELNGKPTQLHNETTIVYANNDLDLELLSQSDYDIINKTYSVKDVLGAIEDIQGRKEQVGFKKLSDTDKKIFNQVNWLCMKVKGRFMVEAGIKWLDENIEKVYKTQAKIELENEDKDIVLGFADLVAKIKGYDKPVVIDFKTSGRMYEPDSVKTSPQLALYVYTLKDKLEKTNLAGFVVFQKNIRKNKIKTCKKCGNDGSGGRHKTCANVINGVRCNGEWDEVINPSVTIQVIVDEISEFFQEQVVGNFNSINLAIKNEIFPRNWNSCIRYNGTVICPYYNYCHKNELGDIIQKEES